MGYAVSFGVVLMMAQILEGTDLTLSCLSFGFIVVTTAAFNLVGGLYFPSGAYIFFASTLTVLVGLVAKAVLGEPAQSNLLNAPKTMTVYLVGMCMLYGAAFFTRRFRRNVGILEGFKIEGQVTPLAAGCLFLAVVPEFLLPEGVRGSWNQFGYYFGYLAVLLPVYDKVKRTDGRKSFALIALLAWGWETFHTGLLTFSKQGIFTSSFCWCVAAAVGGYRLNFRRLLFLGVVGPLGFAILTPYSQVGRNLVMETDGFDTRVNVMIDLLSRPLEVREEYLKQSAEDYVKVDVLYHWYDQPQGILDRLNMFAVDDALVYYTDQGRSGSLLSVWAYVLNCVPRALWPSKPYLNPGNVYAHQIGLLAPDDYSTSVSFSAFAEGYHSGEWIAMTIVFFVEFSLVFWVTDSMAGDIDRSIWGIMYVMLFAHTAPEGGLGFPIYTMGTTTIAITAAAFSITRIAPIVGAVLSLPERRLLKSV